MRRSSIPLFAVVLAVVTAIALLRAAQAITAGIPDGDSLATNRTLAYRFYEGVNDALRTGDATHVSTLVTDDYTEPDQLGGQPGPAALRRRLTALHTSHPDLELVVTDVLVRRNIVVARLHVRGGTDATFLGASLPATPAPWGPIDILRVEHGRIAERRGGDSLAPDLAPLWTATVVDPPVVGHLALTRLTFAPGATTADLRNPGPALIAVESGALTITTVDTTAPNPETVANALGQNSDQRQRPIALGPGVPLALPVAVPYALRNDGSTPVVAFTLAFFPPVRGERAAAAFPPAEALSVALLLHGIVPAPGSIGAVTTRGIDGRYLAGGSFYGMPARSSVLNGGRATLAPGGSLPLPSTPSTTLIVVESGTGELAIAKGLAQTRHDATAPIVSLASSDDPTLGQTAALADGGAAFLPPDAGGTLRNTGQRPLQALMIRIAPGEPEPTT